MFLALRTLTTLKSLDLISLLTATIIDAKFNCLIGSGQQAAPSEHVAVRLSEVVIVLVHQE